MAGESAQPGALEEAVRVGWSGYDLRIHVRVDAHGGEREERGEELYRQFISELERICADERFNNDAITVDF